MKEMVKELEGAESLYQDDFLIEDPYEEWMIPKREALKDLYLIILDRMSRYHLEQGNHATCTHFCKQMLAKDACREDAHRRLMVCYSRQGQPHLALRQYHLCVEALAEGLEVAPMTDTEALYQCIRRREIV